MNRPVLSRRHFLVAATAICSPVFAHADGSRIYGLGEPGLDANLVGGPDWNASGLGLHVQDHDHAEMLGPPFTDALRNLFRVNTLVNIDGAGKIDGSPYIRAGAWYPSIWTRDAAINSWFAASIVSRRAAQHTLDLAIRNVADDRREYWDRGIIVHGAWNHYLYASQRDGESGLDWLTKNAPALFDLMASQEADYFDSKAGLFRGPAFFIDSVGGYPPPYSDRRFAASKVTEIASTGGICSLSANCIQVRSYECLAEINRVLALPPSRGAEFRRKAAALRAAINRRMWDAKRGSYGYFVEPSGDVETFQDAAGLAMAILFDVADAKRAQEVMRTIHLEQYGVPSIWPDLKNGYIGNGNYGDTDEGYESPLNIRIWPHVTALWAMACAKVGNVDGFGFHVEKLAELVNQAGDHNFREIYNAKTGKPYLKDHQTWSATGYLSMFLNGALGLNPKPEGLRFSPCLPRAWGGITMSGLPYRGSVISVRLRGGGTMVRRVELNGAVVGEAFIPASALGDQTLVIDLA